MSRPGASTDGAPAAVTAAEPGPAAIRLAGVGKRFARHGSDPLAAVDNLDLEVAAGEFVAVIGPSGCGKSTLLRLIAGLLEPDGGRVDLAGATPDAARRAKRFALVPQTPALLPWRSVRANIALLGEVNRRHGGGGEADPAAIEALIDAVGLRGFESARPAELSGGMQQRVALARAFALDAPILLMDEPFAALDEITRDEMRFLLSRVWAETGTPRTVVFVTHSIEEAVTLADRVVVLTRRPGRVLEILPVTLPRPRRAELEDTDEFVAHVRAVRSALRRAAAEPGRFR
jgi:NitT/TauT family transport system ATP-binding protein